MIRTFCDPRTSDRPQIGLQSDWTSKIPQNKYSCISSILIFSYDFVIWIKNFKKHHLFDFSHFGTCSFNEILFIFVTSLSVTSSKKAVRSETSLSSCNISCSKENFLLGNTILKLEIGEWGSKHMHSLGNIKMT